jgi:membrane protein
MAKLKNLAKCFYTALVDTIQHDGIEHAGYLAFLAILSLFPFLVFFVAIVGFFGETDVGLKLIHLILDNHLIPSHIMPALEPRINEIASGPPQGLLTVSIIGAIWTASSSVDGLRTILNRAYRVSTPPAYIWRRLMSIAEFLIFTAIIILVTFLLIIAPNILEYASNLLHLTQLEQIMVQNGFSEISHWNSIRYVLTTTIILFLVATSYRILPNIKQTWKDVLPGSIVVVLLWFVAGSLFSAYLSNFQQVNIIYGSLGGMIAALLFFYIDAMIFVYGAELNHLITQALGREIKEKEVVTSGL